MTPGNRDASAATPPGRLLTVSEAARALSVSNMTVYRLVRSGRLPALQVGGRSYRITEDDLNKYQQDRFMDAG